MYSHVACDVMKERTLYLLKPSSLIWHLMPYLFLFTKNICLVDINMFARFDEFQQDVKKQNVTDIRTVSRST